MKVTTPWSFRRKYLNTYTIKDFANDWDYFVYLHINRHVQWVHLGGTLVGLSLFPWAMIHLFRDHSFWQTMVFTFFYYGLGFISHWTGDGQVSGTWKQLLRTYRQAAQMNILVLTGKFKREEKRVMEKYKPMMWIYFKDQTPPSNIV